MVHRYLPVAAALAAILLTLPSLQVGLLFDDYHHKLLFDDSNSALRLLRAPLDLFRFFDGDRHKTERLIDYGGLPWWTYPGIRGAFWRPLASATHWFDYRIWPRHPALMHLQSLAWYGLAVLTVALLYRRFLGAVPAAGLAALLFAIDDAHAMPAAFLSNRSDLLAVFFAALCLIAHDAWRRRGRRRAGLLAPLLLLASLLSKEAGVSTCGYLLAYAIFLDSAPPGARLRSLLPSVAVVLIWRGLWAHLGYGVAELGLYIDPIRTPGMFFSAAIERGPVLLLGQWAMPPADVAFMAGPALRRLLWAAAIVVLALIAVLVAPLIRRDRLARFWACGMLLALLPACATFPSDRLLMFTGLGAMPLVGHLLVGARPEDLLADPGRRWLKFQRGAVALLVGVHLVLAPILLVVRSAWPAGPRSFRAQFSMIEPLDASIRGQDLVIVNPPDTFVLLGSLLTWAGEGDPLPRHARILVSSALQPVHVYRPDAQTLVVQPEAGYLAGPLDDLFRRQRRPFKRGDQITLTGLTIELTEIGADGKPLEVRFKFAVPLEDASLRWIYWEKGQFLPFTPPAIGGRRILQADHWLARLGLG